MEEFELGIGDIILGGSGAGRDYIVHQWDGLGIPSIRNSDSQRPQDYGSFLGPDVPDSRDIRIDVTIRGDDPADAVMKLNALLREWHLDTRTDTTAIKPLMLRLPGQQTWRLHGRPRRASFETARIIGSRIDGTLEYFGADPRWYSDVEHQTALALATATTGRGYNKSFNYGYGGSGSSGVQTITNEGSIGTLPTVTFYGPVTNPFIENVTTNRRLRLVYTIGVGEFIVVNFAEATVLLGGAASRYFAKSGEFWELVPGPNEIRFGADAYDAAAYAFIEWRDAWI